MRKPLLDKDKSLTDIRTATALNDLVVKPRNTIRLKTFEDKFLRVLAIKSTDTITATAMLTELNQRTNYNNNAATLVHNLLNEWGNDVGDYRLYTDCVDQSGHVVYVIPPLLDNESDFTDHADKIPMLVELADKQPHPRLASAYIGQNILPLIKKPSVNQEWVELWNIIFKYHDMPLLKISETGNGVTTEEEQKVDDQTIHDFDEYD